MTDADAAALDIRLVASATGSTATGPSSFTVAGCPGGRLHYVVSGDGATLGSGDATDAAGSGSYAIDVSALGVGHRGTLKLDITIVCGQQPDQHTTAILFADPSGTVVDDGAGGAALAGATVTLLDSGGDAIPRRPAALAGQRRQPRDERRARPLGLGRRATAPTACAPRKPAAARSRAAL